MSDMMTFPETWEEFEKFYGFNDSDEIYTNNSRLIPSFRVKQWLDHIAQHENKQQATVSSDLISRQDAINAFEPDHHVDWYTTQIIETLESLPSAKPERLTDDDFETIRIHLNAYKEKLCNQRRWEEAEEYQCIIDRFMAFASAEPEIKPISYQDCSNAMLMMWMDNVLTDGEYNRIMEKLNSKHMTGMRGDTSEDN